MYNIQTIIFLKFGIIVHDGWFIVLYAVCFSRAPHNIFDLGLLKALIWPCVQGHTLHILRKKMIGLLFEV